MREVFIDTSGWASLFVRSEPFHPAADALMRSCQGDGTIAVTTNYVILELVALFTSPLRLPRVQQVRAIEAIQAASWVEVVHIDPGIHLSAWSLLASRADKLWSLVDCSSFALMNQRGTQEALTTDHHFEQAGFRRLLK